MLINFSACCFSLCGLLCQFSNNEFSIVNILIIANDLYILIQYTVLFEEWGKDVHLMLWNNIISFQIV
jgi:hypothetical protein